MSLPQLAHPTHDVTVVALLVSVKH